MRSVHDRSLWQTILGGTIATVVIYLFVSRHFSSLVAICAGLLTGIASALFEYRKQDVKLRISKFEFQVSGNFGVYRPPSFIPMAKIQRLEYRQQQGGGPDGHYQPSGLYVEYEQSSGCVLPNLNESQTLQAIGAIYKRFPQIPLCPKPNGSPLFDDDITRLKLS